METTTTLPQEQSLNITAEQSEPILEVMEQKVISLVQARPNGISDKDLTVELPNLQPIERANTINKLLQYGYLNVFKEGKSLFYRFKDPSKAKVVKGADNEEKIVYTLIEEAGNKGIWIRDIKLKSNLMPNQLNKIVKNLEAKQFIKAVKAVTAGNKKIYMLYNLEPDRSITGGAWYENQDFETEFVDILSQQCYRFLEQKREKAKDCTGGPIIAKNMTYASSTDVLKFITDLGISKVKLSVEELEMILNTLVYDGKVEQMLAADGSNHYRVIQPLLLPSGLIRTPCGICPVRSNCSLDGDITPIKCEYMNEWLL